VGACDQSPNVLLRLDRLSRTYDSIVPVPALHETSLSILEGDFLSISGPSGSGKSTLMNLLGLLDRPNTGTYEVAGIETTALGEQQRTSLRAHCFGFIFQAFHLLSDRTVIENVELGMLYQGIPRKDRQNEASRTIEQVGLGNRMNALPPTLSGGERQRTAIARALVARPRVVLCDEPTGNLDQSNASVVLDVLEGLNELGLTIVIVTHDADVAGRASRHLRVSDGMVTE
jgi:putative ABC transport system ATP-binding protein